MNVDSFRNTLKLRKHLKKELMQAEENLDQKYYVLTGLNGVNPSKEPMMPGPDNYWKLDIIEDIALIKEDIQRIKLNLKYIDRLLGRLSPPVRSMCVDLFERNWTYDKVAYRNNLSVNQLEYLIRKSVKEL